MLASAGLNRLRRVVQALATPLWPATNPGTGPYSLCDSLFLALAIPPPILGQSIRSIGIKTFEVPDNKRIQVGLQYIHGIGRHRARQLLCEVCIENKPAKELTPRERFILGEEVFRYLIDRELKQFNKNAVERLKHIQSYRGMRHADKLPCRGQRTHTNARTVKGKVARIPAAAKKKPKK